MIDANEERLNASCHDRRDCPAAFCHLLDGEWHFDARWNDPSNGSV
jgi:hypothetical protein